MKTGYCDQNKDFENSGMISRSRLKIEIRHYVDRWQILDVEEPDDLKFKISFLHYAKKYVLRFEALQVLKLFTKLKSIQYFALDYVCLKQPFILKFSVHSLPGLGIRRGTDVFE